MTPFGPARSKRRRRDAVTSARRRATSLALATAVLVVVTLATLAGSASATYDPQYYDDPGYATAVTSLGLAYGSYTGATLEAGMNTGGGSASASQAQAIRQALTEARWAGKFLPAARTLGAIGLGVTAFDVGWKIGRSIDTKYLHMYNLTTGEIGMDDTYGTVRDSPNGWEWKFTGGEWRKTVYSEFGATCGPLDVIPSTFTGTLVDLFGPARTNCKQFLLDAYVSLASVAGTVGSTTTVTCPTSFFGSSYNGSAGTCYRIVASEASMSHYLASKVDVFKTWSSESYSFATSAYEPGWSSQGFASQAAQNEAFTNVFTAFGAVSAPEFAEFAVNPTGSVANPLIDWEMPSCYGLSVDDCESAVSEAADGADAAVSFNVVAAPVDDEDVAKNLVVGTFPAVSALARPEEVTLTKNSTNASEKTCLTETANAHPSEHNPTMQAEGVVRCNYTGVSSYQMWIWECSSEQTSDPGELFDDVFGGAFGCDLKETTSGEVEVVARALAQSGGSPIFCPNLIEQSHPMWTGVPASGSPVQSQRTPLQS